MKWNNEGRRILRVRGLSILLSHVSSRQARGATHRGHSVRGDEVRWRRVCRGRAIAHIQAAKRRVVLVILKKALLAWNKVQWSYITHFFLAVMIIMRVWANMREYEGIWTRICKQHTELTFFSSSYTESIAGSLNSLVGYMIGGSFPYPAIPLWGWWAGGGATAATSGAFKHDWMRFFPSGLVMRGWSLGVAKVYTCPVSEATKRRTWVPVRVLNSYACM